jgi:integrase
MKILGKKIGTHIFRHTYASYLMNDNVDLEKIRKLLGHSTSKTTLIYIQSLPDFSSWEKVRENDLLNIKIKMKFNE